MNLFASQPISWLLVSIKPKVQENDMNSNILLVNKVILINSFIFLKPSISGVWLSNEIEENLSVLKFVSECTISVVDSIVMVVPYSYYQRTIWCLSEAFVVLKMKNKMYLIDSESLWINSIRNSNASHCHRRYLISVLWKVKFYSLRP